MKDTYQTIAGLSYGEFKDKGSKFHAYAYPTYTDAAWQGHLAKVKKEHFKARHHCYAYRMGMDKNNFRANDDGEPSGTAGKPILGQIDSFQLTNVFVVVVRYFGGVKLGTSGLINAYRESAKAALAEAEVIQKVVEDIYQFRFDYSLMSKVMNVVKKQDFEIVTQRFEQEGLLEVAIPQSLVAERMRIMRAQIAGVHLEEIDQIEEIPGLEIEFGYTR